MLFIKGLSTLPHPTFKAQGFVDIWWVVQEGGLLLLVGHLLRQHRTYRSCTLRVFTVAQHSCNPAAVALGLRRLLRNLRIQVCVLGGHACACSLCFRRRCRWWSLLGLGCRRSLRTLL